MVRRESVVVLTRPRVRVISNTKWEVNITRKYQVAPSAMILESTGSLSPCAFVFIAKNIIATNARESIYTSSHKINRIQGRAKDQWFKRTKAERDAGICNLQCSTRDEYALVVCIEGYRWEAFCYRVHRARLLMRVIS